jgi:hypothetical protein
MRSGILMFFLIVSVATLQFPGMAQPKEAADMSKARVRYMVNDLDRRSRFIRPIWGFGSTVR